MAEYLGEFLSQIMLRNVVNMPYYMIKIIQSSYLSIPSSAVKHVLTWGLEGSIVTILSDLLAISAGQEAA